MEKILKRNNLKAPSANDFQNLKTVNPEVEIDKKVLLEDLKFYHTERLKAIYAERAHFNFISIQSIADEINSLKLLNPKKGEDLFNKFPTLLEKTEFQTETKLNLRLSNVTGVKGELIINGEKINLNSTNHTEKYDSMVKEGIFATNGALYAITYHTGIHNEPTNWHIYGDDLFSKLGSFINLGAGYVLYPSWFYTNTASQSTFNTPFPTCPVMHVYFPVSAGSIVENTKRTGIPCIGSYNIAPTGNVSGTFVAAIGGNFVTAVGSKTF